MVLVFATADISGGHLNPAVSIAFLVTQVDPKFTVVKCIVWILYQCAGAIFGALFLKGMPPYRCSPRPPLHGHTRRGSKVRAPRSFFFREGFKVSVFALTTLVQTHCICPSASYGRRDNQLRLPGPASSASISRRCIGYLRRRWQVTSRRALRGAGTLHHQSLSCVPVCVSCSSSRQQAPTIYAIRTLPSRNSPRLTSREGLQVNRSSGPAVGFHLQIGRPRTLPSSTARALVKLASWAECDST